MACAVVVQLRIGGQDQCPELQNRSLNRHVHPSACIIPYRIPFDMALPKSSTLQISHRGGYALGGFHDMHGNLVRHQFGSRGEYPRSTDGGNDLSPVVANGGCDAVDAFFGFFIVVSPAPLSASMDIFDDGFDGGVGVGAEAFELNTREKSADLLVVHVQQEGLAEGSTVQGFLLADDFVFAEAGVLILLVDVDHHGALAPREKDDGVQG